MTNPAYIGNARYEHGSASKIGVLLVNLGTPAAPTPPAVRAYLKQFLSDPRVIETPRWRRWVWWCVLYGIVLPFRSRRSAAAYRSIWTADGSPLLVHSRAQAAALQSRFATATGAGGSDNVAMSEKTAVEVAVALAMSYGSPSIPRGIDDLLQKNCRYLLVLPMYPQYAASTVGSVFDAVAATLRRRRAVPHLRFVSSYGDDPYYIDALATSIRAFWQQHGQPAQLLFSFHGTPLAMLHAGDFYHCHCHKTARLTAEQLGLQPSQWQVSFQSRFGRARWLQPYTDSTLKQLGGSGVESLHVVCPAFAADCLETLEEIAIEGKETFQTAGGGAYAYIPALNADPAHIDFLAGLIDNAISDWRADCAHHNAHRIAQADAYRNHPHNK